MQATITRRILLCAGLGGFFTGQALFPGFLRRDGDRMVNGQGQEVILRGIGLGGWMLQEPYMLRLSKVAVNQSQIRARITDLVGEARTTAFYEAWRAHQTTKGDIDSLASWGFNAVRVPLHYNLFTLDADQEPIPGQNTWLQTGFALTDSLLSWCRVNHIYLILDLHAAPGGQGNDLAISDRNPNKPSLWQSPANQQKLVALWRRLAERYASDPWIGGYDLINETNWGFTTPATDEHGCAEKDNTPLRALLERTTDTIRAVDPRHIIFIEGNCWANNFHGLLPLWDSNMVVSFHKYWNYNDQGSIQGMIDMRARYHVPLWLGESGENSNTWTTDAIALVEKNHISWTWWPLKKAGLNNPLEFRLPEGWDALVAYWEGKGPRPTADAAYHLLMELATNAGVSRNTYHKDVVDAMFRQVATDKTSPYQGLQVQPGTRLYGVNYDLGRNGFAYYDMDTANFRTSTGHSSAWNRGGYYRNDGVDIIRCGDSLSMGYAVTDIEPGEWLQYTVNVPRSGYYTVSYRVEPAPEDRPAQLGKRVTAPSSADTPAAAAAAAAIAAPRSGNRHKVGSDQASMASFVSAPPSWELLDYTDSMGALILDDCSLPVAATGSMTVPTGSRDSDADDASPPKADVLPWVSTGTHQVYLSEGVHRLRLLARNSGFRLSYIEFQ
jgi:endoglucanase